MRLFRQALACALVVAAIPVLAPSARAATECTAEVRAALKSDQTFSDSVLKVPAQTATNIELTRAYIQKARQTIIADDMKLTEEESLAFWPAERDYRVDMARLGDRLVKVIAEFVSAEASLNDEQASRLLDEYLDIKAKDVSVRQKHVKVFRKLLPASKVTRFFQLENKLDAVVNFELAQTVPLTR